MGNGEKKKKKWDCPHTLGKWPLMTSEIGYQEADPKHSSLDVSYDAVYRVVLSNGRGLGGCGWDVSSLASALDSSKPHLQSLSNLNVSEKRLGCIVNQSPGNADGMKAYPLPPSLLSFFPSTHLSKCSTYCSPNKNRNVGGRWTGYQKKKREKKRKAVFEPRLLLSNILASIYKGILSMTFLIIIPKDSFCSAPCLMERVLAG